VNLAESIAGHAATQPAVTALAEGGRAIDYAELDRLIRQGAAHLRALGIGVGDRVAICLADTADHVIAFLSAARLGATALPIDWRAPPAERARVAQAFGARLALVQTGDGAVAAVPSLTLDARWYAEAERQDSRQDFPAAADLPLMIGLTSGTTGVVKGLRVTHAQMHARTIPFDRILDPGSHRYFSASPLAFSAGRGYCLTHLIRGHTVILHPPLFSAEEYIETVNRSAATVAFVVPTILRNLLALPASGGPLLPRIQALICAGAPTHAEEKRAALERITPNLFEIYGTVGTGPITVLRPEEMETHTASAGRPAEVWEIEIVNGADRALPRGGEGRLRLRGPGVAEGLYAQGASVGEAIRDGWYYTGDIAVLDAEGFLHLKGRATDVILRGGSNIYPDEIEAVLAEHAAVAEAAVVARPSPQLGEEVVAFIVARGPVAVDELAAHCRRRLSAYKVPAEIRLVEALPRTNFGKADRKRLAASLTAVKG
jgi:acyl-CoA synthetase (AMP-forming)/AMP-acid ligase II